MILDIFMHLLHSCLPFLFVISIRSFDPDCFKFLHFMVFVFEIVIFWEIYEIFRVFKEEKGFVEFQNKSGNRRRNKTSFRKVKTIVLPQCKIGYTHHPLHRHAYICGHTLLCKINFLTYSQFPYGIWTISVEWPCIWTQKKNS